jgi:hypothetical protein
MDTWRLTEALDKLDRIDFEKIEKNGTHIIDLEDPSIVEFYRGYKIFTGNEGELEQVNSLLMSYSEDSIKRLRNYLSNQNVPLIIIEWCASVLGIIGGNNELDLIKQVHSKIKSADKQNGYRDHLDFQLKLLSCIEHNKKAESTNIFGLICTFLEENLRLMNETRQEEKFHNITQRQMRDTLCIVSNALTKFLDEQRLKRLLQEKEDFLNEKKNLFSWAFRSSSNYIDQVNWGYEVREWYHFRYNIACIIDKIDGKDNISYDLNNELNGIQENVSSQIAVWLAGSLGEFSTAKILYDKLESNNFPNFELDLLVALGTIGKRYSEGQKGFEVLNNMVEPLTKRMIACEFRANECVDKSDPSNIDTEIRSLTHLRVLENIQGPERTAEFVASKGLNSNELERKLYARVLGGLTKKQIAFNALKIKFLDRTSDQRETAKWLMTEMGLADAVKLLVAQDNEKLFEKYVGEPIAQIEQECKSLLKDTVDQVKKGYRTINYMGIIVFAVGIFIIAAGASIAVIGHSDPAQLVAGGASMLAGIGTVLINFTKGPVKIVQKALADLVQVETAFIGYIRRTGLASFVFLREYIQQDKEPNSAVLELCNSQMSEAAKDTMALIELYSGESETIKKLSPDKQELLCHRAIGDNQINSDVNEKK